MLSHTSRSTHSRGVQKFSIAILLTFVVGAFALLMPLQALAQSADPTPDDSLRDAIQKHIESEGHIYAGLCREIDQWEHHGETCAFVLSIEDGVATVTYGPVATDSLKGATFVQREGDWVPGELPEPTPQLPITVPGGLEDAIRDFLEQRGLTYAGLCKEIDQSQHYGEYCAFINAVVDGKADVSYGLVASDGLESEGFVRDENGWHAESSGPIVPPDDATPEPTVPTPADPTAPVDEPADGGDNDDSDDSDGIGAGLILALAAGTVIAGGAGAYGFRRSRR